MQSSAIKSIITCALGIVIVAGCAAPTSQTAMQSNVRPGKVSSIEPAMASDQPMPMSSSGASAAGTMASGGQNLVVVDFADGTQGRYVSSSNYPVGTAIEVVTMGDRTMFRSAMPQK